MVRFIENARRHRADKRLSMNDNVIDITRLIEARRLYHLLYQAMEDGETVRAEELALQVAELTGMEHEIEM